MLPTGIAASIYAGIGTKYEGESAEELAIKAGLNWQVITKNHYYPVDVEGKEEYYPSAYKTAYRGDNPKVEFGPVGTTWEPFQNEDVLSTFLDFCTESGSQLLKVGQFNQGKTIWGLADTKKEFSIDGDVINGLMLIHNGNTWGKGFSIEILTWRQVCSNGLTIKLSAGRDVLKHNRHLTPDRIKGVMANLHAGFNKYELDMNLLSKTHITLEEATAFIIQKFGSPSKMNITSPLNSDMSLQPKAVQRILEIFNSNPIGDEYKSMDESAFRLLQAITQYFNHEAVQRGGLETHVHSLWLSSKAEKQRKAMQGLISLSNQRMLGNHVPVSVGAF